MTGSRARTIGVLDLERVMARGWRAEHRQWLGQWLLRGNGGFTGRANSVLPLGDPAQPLDDALAAVHGFYDRHGLPARMSVPTPDQDALADAITRRGWRAAWGARVMTAPIGDVPRPEGPPVHLHPEPSLAWQAAYHYRGGRVPDDGRRLLVRHDTVAFASVGEGMDIVAIGRGAVDDGWLGITAVEVDPTHRRRGLARRLLGALVDWGVARGAHDVYLQVDLANDAAIELYGGAGFDVHHTYHYWDAPTG